MSPCCLPLACWAPEAGVASTLESALLALPVVDFGVLVLVLRTDGVLLDLSPVVPLVLGLPRFGLSAGFLAA